MSDAKPFTADEVKRDNLWVPIMGDAFFVFCDRLRATVEALEKAKEEAANWHAAFSQKAYPAESCRKQRDDGNGGCGACSICCHELRQRAEKAEAERDEARAELASISQEFGLPPTIRPVEGEIRRMLDGWREARAEVARLQDLHTRCAAFDDQPGPSCVTLAAKCATLEAERDEARADAARLRERLQIDPGGSDKIDELSAALDYLHADAARLREALECFVRQCECAPDDMTEDAWTKARAALATDGGKP